MGQVTQELVLLEGASVRTLESPIKLVCHVPGGCHYICGPQLPSVHSWKEWFIIYLLKIRPSFMKFLASITIMMVWVLTSMLECHSSVISQQGLGSVFLSLRLSHVTAQTFSVSSAPFPQSFPSSTPWITVLTCSEATSNSSLPTEES